MNEKILRSSVDRIAIILIMSILMKDFSKMSHDFSELLHDTSTKSPIYYSAVTEEKVLKSYV